MDNREIIEKLGAIALDKEKLDKVTKAVSIVQRFTELTEEEQEEIIGEEIDFGKAVNLIVEHFVENTESNNFTIEGLEGEELNEALDILKNTKSTERVFYSDQTIIKALVQRNTNKTQGETSVNLSRGGNDLMIENGNLPIFDLDVFTSIITCYAEGVRVTKGGKVYLKIVDINKDLSGSNKDSMRPKRRQDIIDSLERMGFRLKCTTNKELARVMNADESELPEEYQNTDIFSLDEQFLTYKLAKGTRYGKTIEIAICELSEPLRKLANYFGWMLEEVSYEDKCIKEIDENGELKDWRLTKERIELRTCLIRWIIAYKRARTSRPTSPVKPYSPKKPYKSIFDECQLGDIKTMHGTTVRRKKNDIAVILDHFKRQGIITDWYEYTNIGKKRPEGIEIYVQKDALE